MSVSDIATLTLRETAYVFGDKVKNIVPTNEEHASLGFTERRGGRTLRVLGMPDLIYIQALNEMGELLSPKGRFTRWTQARWNRRSTMARAHEEYSGHERL